MAEDEHPAARPGSPPDPYEALQFARRAPLDGAKGGIVCPKHPGRALQPTGIWGVVSLGKEQVGLAPAYFCVDCHRDAGSPERRERRERTIRRA